MGATPVGCLGLQISINYTVGGLLVEEVSVGGLLAEEPSLEGGGHCGCKASWLWGHPIHTKHVCIYIYIYICMHMYIYIYIYGVLQHLHLLKHSDMSLAQTTCAGACKDFQQSRCVCLSSQRKPHCGEVGLNVSTCSLSLIRHAAHHLCPAGVPHVLPRLWLGWRL